MGKYPRTWNKLLTMTTKDSFRFADVWPNLSIRGDRTGKGTGHGVIFDVIFRWQEIPFRCQDWFSDVRACSPVVGYS